MPSTKDECDVPQTRTRTRSCSNPAPSCEGKACDGSAKDVPGREAAGNNCCPESDSVVGSFWNKGSKDCIQCRAFCEPGLTQTTDCQTDKSDGSTANRVCKDLTSPVITLSGDSPTTQEGGHDYKDPGFKGTDSFEGDITGRVQFNVPDMRSVGEQKITYQLMDKAGNRATARARVCNVIDTTAPKITIVGEETQEVHLTHEGGTQYTDPGATAYDLVDGDVAVATSGADFDNTHVKVHTVTYTSIDAEKNSGSVTRTVTVVDTNIPEITLVGDAFIRVHAHRNIDYVDTGATASDLVDGDITDKIVMMDPVDLRKPKEDPYVVAFDVTDVAGLKAKTVHRKVIVEDIVPPEIVLKGDAAVVLEAATDYVEAGWTSMDDLDGDVTNTVVVTYKDHTGSAVSGIDPMVPDKSVFTITYTSTDAAQNSFSLSRTLTIRDRTPPVFALDLETTLEFDVEYDEPGWKATDALDGDLTARVTVEGPFLRTTRIGQLKETLTQFNKMSISDVGSTYAVKYTCVDDAGNSATQTRVVTVVDTVIPTLIMRGPTAVEHEGGTRYDDRGARATDNYDNAVPRRCAGCTPNGRTGDISREIDLLVFINGTEVSKVDEKAPSGTLYTLRYVVKDSSNNAAVPVEREVLIIDTIPPTLSVLSEDGRTLQTSDDEPFVVPHLDYQAGGPDSTFADPGIKAEDVLDGDVTDRVAITYVQTNLATKKLRAECGGEAADGRQEGSSNKVVPFINTAEAAGTAYTITYTISDVQGNEASAQRTVTLVDKVPPTIRRVGQEVQKHEAGFAFRDLGAVATDVVSGLLTGCVEISVTSKGGDTAINPKRPAGTRFDVTYLVEDDAGQSSKATKVLDLVDTIPPELTVLGPLESIHRLGESYIGAECVCSDIGDPDIECSPSIASLSLKVPGLFTNTFSCADASDNTARVVGSVRVLPAASNEREGPTKFSVNVDLDAFRDRATTSTTVPITTATPSSMAGRTIALDFEISFPAPGNGESGSGDGSGDGSGTPSNGTSPNSTSTETRADEAAQEIELLLRSTIESTGNLLFDDASVVRGAVCDQSPSGSMVCTVVVKGTGVNNGDGIADAVASIGGVVTGDGLAVVGFEGAIVLPDDTELQAIIEFPQLDMATTDINAINAALERALGGDVINAGVVGNFKWRTGADGKMVTALATFRSISDAQKATANEQVVRTFAMGVYRQLTETDGIDSSSTGGAGGVTSGSSSDSGSSLDKARAHLLLERAGFDNVPDMMIHCTDGVCVFWGRDMPTQSQFNRLSNLDGVQQASKMTVKVAPGAERVWYAAWMSAQTDEKLSEIEAAGLAGVSLRRRKCTDGEGSKCPVLFSSVPSATTLKAVEVLVGDASLTVEPYAREAACFEPDLQGGPSNDEGRALLHIAGLSALEIQCSPGTVCCFSTAFPYDLQPLQDITQVSRVSSTVFGPPAAAPRAVMQFMATGADSDITKLSDSIQAAVESSLPESTRQRARRANSNAGGGAVRVECDSVGKQHCAASFDLGGPRVDEGGVSSDAMASLRTAVGKVGVVAFPPVASTGLKGSLSFSPAKLAVDPAVARYLLVENNVDAKAVACAAGGCKYTVSSLRDLPSQVTTARAVLNMNGEEIRASVAPVSGFQAKGAFVATSEYNPITTSEAESWLSAAGILASTVSCSGATCIFDVDYFTGSHTSLLMASGNVLKVIFPVSTGGDRAPNTFAGSFASVKGATLSNNEATALLLAAGIVADDDSIACKQGTCEFRTSQDVGLAGIDAMFGALAEMTSDATNIAGPDLVDDMFLLKKAILDSIVDSAGARPEQVIFNGIVNETSGEISFSIMPICGTSTDPDERALAEADGCVDVNDHFIHSAEFDGDRDELEDLLNNNGVAVVNIRDEGGGTYIVTTEMQLTDSQKSMLDGFGVRVTGTSRDPVLSIKEIQGILEAKAFEGELGVPLTTTEILATSTNRTASDPPFPIIPVAAGAGGLLLLIIIAVLCVFCDCACCAGSGSGHKINWNSSQYASPGAIGFENPMYDQSGPSNGFYDDVPGHGGAAIVPGGFYDDVPAEGEYYEADMYDNEGEGNYDEHFGQEAPRASSFANNFEQFDGFDVADGDDDDGYLEVQADHDDQGSASNPTYAAAEEVSHDGQGEQCASHLVTGRTCTRMKISNSKFCVNHSCPAPDCGKLKSSKSTYCNDHRAEYA